MLDRRTATHDSNTRRAARAALRLTLALAATCGAGFAQTPAPTPAPARARRVEAEADLKPGVKPRGETTTVVNGRSATKPGDPKADAAKAGATKADAATAGATKADAKPAGAGADARKAAPVESHAKRDAAAKQVAEGAAADGKVAASADDKVGASSDENAGASVADGAGAKDDAGGVEAELERLRAQIKSAAPERRGQLQRALVARLVALGRGAEALSELRLLIHEDRFDPAFFFNTGNALARLGDANAAADAYRKAVSQRHGNYARALNNLGVVLTRQGRWDEAYDALRAALTQENFTYAEASYNLGRLHLLRGEANLAMREWGRTLSLRPDHADAAAALARALAEDGDEERAFRLLENFTARAAGAGGTVPREIASARADIAAMSERGDDGGRRGAASVGASPSGVGPAPTVAARETSSSPARTPSPAAASAPRTDAREFGVDRVTYSALQAARDAAERGRNEEAVRQYRGVLSRSGGYFPPANLELSFALMNLNRAEEAVAALRPLTERDSARYPVAHYHLARLQERLGRPEEAARHFARAAELYGDANPQALADLSRVREKTGDTRGALDALEAYSVAIAQQGSVPHWVVERADALRAKLKAAPPTKQ